MFVDVKCHLQFCNGKQCISIEFFFKLRNTVAEMPEMLKTGFDDNVIGITKLLSDFLDSNVGKFLLKVSNIHVITPGVVCVKTLRVSV